MRRFLLILMIALPFAVGLGASPAMAENCADGTVKTSCGAGLGADDVYVGGVVVTQAPQALAFTGSSNSTPSMVYIGMGAVTVGLVLFVATRRRRSVLDQA